MLPRTMNYSTSDSALSLISSPHPSLLRLDRKVTADISLLADQNAELMDKLEKLEAEASSADQTGRRELKRLEKEIAFLREAFEKTQAKSEELEEKVQDAVVGEAWRKKQEREAKFRAMRHNGRDVNRQEVKSFAPDGSRFGGPSDGFSFFPTATSPDPRHRQIKASNSDMELELSGFFSHSEHSLISQLLVKVQELEETNTQILKQQNETATQLSVVQRETEHITKAYESWVDPDAVKSQFESDVAALDSSETPFSMQTVKQLRSIGPNTDARSLEGEDGFVQAQEFTSAPKNRKTVIGLFSHDSPAVDSPLTLRTDNLQLPSRSPSPSSESLQDHLSWSTGGGGLESTGALSPLHFFSPATQVLQDLTPLESRPTLQSELSKELGDTWDMGSSIHHGRTSSLYDLSQFSVPATPSPASRAMSRRASDELDFETLKNGGLCTSLPMSGGLLRLSVEPPTPVKAADFEEYAKSPRVQRMSETLRSRTGRWVDRRFKEGHQSAKATSAHSTRTGSPLAEPTVRLPQLLSHAIDTMIQKFDGLSEVDKQPQSNTTSPRDTLPDDNALQLHVASPSKKETKKHVLGGLLFEIWLWLQFAIIIFVFICAMAKRGPKVMLVDAERKKAVAAR